MQTLAGTPNAKTARKLPCAHVWGCDANRRYGDACDLKDTACHDLRFQRAIGQTRSGRPIVAPGCRLPPRRGTLGTGNPFIRQARMDRSPNLPGQHHCPICQTVLRPIERYPRYVCSACEARATSRDGRPLGFGNTGISGGFEGRYLDSGESYDSARCWIDGIACVAQEARFGGIVIQPLMPST